jgi:Tannase-like family of unknown function (DUF6351)
MRTLKLTVMLAAALVAVLPTAAHAKSKKPPKALTISVLSSRADLVSGGDALLAIGGVKSADDLRVTAGGRNQTAAFAAGGDGRVQGVVTGLKVGKTTVLAKAPGRTAAQLTLVNHPIGGPVFSGPQIQPWNCQAGAKDKQCNADREFAYSYLPAGTDQAGVGVNGIAGVNAFRPYDPQSPPPDSQIAKATTTDGVTVPFIVRKETGYLDRDQYAIAALWQPGKPWTAPRPQPQFNRRLVFTHGASCDTEYGTGKTPEVMNPELLGKGFVVASHALDNAGHNCNLATQAEALYMTKERVIDSYGNVKWTIGTGCSGGSLTQQQVANAYPGLYQAITPQCSFTDAWSSAMQYEDYYGLLKYFEDPGKWNPGVLWDPLSISAVLDHPNIANPVTFTNVIPNSGLPTRSCPQVPDEQVYDPKTNPGGVKCTLQDYMVNVFGKRPDGFANRAFGNAGIQFGLDGLRSGSLSPAQFVDVNAKLGGLDYNGNATAERVEPDLLGLERAYKSGAVNSANNLDQVAIIDLRGPDPGAFHDVYRTYAMRARLERNFGTAANQILWRGQAPLVGDPSFGNAAVLAADRWAARFMGDGRKVPLAQKIREDKPGDLADRCTDGGGKDVPAEVCDQTVAAYGTPRYAADEPKTDDVMQCQLKPLRREDYNATFTDAQWATLQKTFPKGVCDYSKPGVLQQGAIPWLTYQDAKGNVVYGGKPMGPAPKSKPVRAKKKR